MNPVKSKKYDFDITVTDNTYAGELALFLTKVAYSKAAAQAPQLATEVSRSIFLDRPGLGLTDSLRTKLY